MKKIIGNINKYKYVWGTIIVLFVYICFFREQLFDVLSEELNKYIMDNNMSIILGLYGISFGVVSVVTILSNKGNHILWVDVVDYQLIDNKLITMKDMYFLLVVILCINTISCFKRRIMDCLIGYVINVVLLFLIIYKVIEIFYIRNKIIKKLERTYRRKDTKAKLEIIDKLYFMTCGYIEERNLSKIDETITFVERILLTDYKILDFWEKYFIKIYVKVWEWFGESRAKKIQCVYVRYRKKLWESTEIGDVFFRKIMRELLKRDITLTSICALYHEIMHKTSGVRNEIYLKLSKHFLEEEKLSKDEKILLSKMYLGREGEDNIVNLIINKRGITCILYDCFLKLLLMGLEYEDQDILRVVNSAMPELEEEILKKCILNISYNGTREYWVQWEKMGQHTLFGDFYKDLDEAYKKINCLIEVQKNVSVDSVYGNEFFWCLKSIKEQLCTLIFNGIFIVECTGKKMEFNIHMHDVSRMKLKAFVVGDCAFAGYNTREMGVHLEEDEEHNIISVRQKANTDKYYLVFFREFDWINREKGIRQVVSAKKWKIHKSRFGKKDYEYKEPEASELQKRKRRI